jgi:deoxyribose-phosphate aldolase
MINKDNLVHIIEEFNRIVIPIEDTRGKEYNSTDVASYIDHTLLKADATGSEIIKLCSEAKKYGFASVCVNPVNVDLCTQELFGSTVKICTVIGFPLGANETATKLAEAELAISSGAAEIDMVINIGRLKDNDQNFVFTEISSLANLCHKNSAILKVIIETAFISDEEKVLACLLSTDAKADFVKTSTGFSKSGANIRDVALMKFSVGNKAKVKASGGVKSYKEAVLMILNGASRLGTSSGIQIIEKSLSTSNY